MKHKKEIIIIGAGPSGLSMAIFLNELGYNPKIIDKKTHISEHSKALGVNPRTLDIFQSFGITERFIANGRRMDAINFWKADKHVYKVDYSKVRSAFPFMLIQAQKESEEILLEEANKRNIEVEYNTEFIEWDQFDSKYSILIDNEKQCTPKFDYVIGADGGHSKIRQLLDIEYKGYRYDEEWELFDIELETELNLDEGHIRVFPEGGMIMIRLKDNIWRVAGSMNDLLNYLPKKTTAAKIHWESTFRINHKVAKQLATENVVLIGDAAHLHSPIGARGMNLGIEDAYIASQLINENRLLEYNSLRRPYLEKTVNRINNMTMGLAGDSNLSRILRNQIGNMKLFFPLLMPNVRKFVLGLDK